MRLAAEVLALCRAGKMSSTSKQRDAINDVHSLFADIIRRCGKSVFVKSALPTASIIPKFSCCSTGLGYPRFFGSVAN